MNAAVRRFREDAAVYLGHRTGIAIRYTSALRRRYVVMLRCNLPGFLRQPEPIQPFGSERL